MQVMLTLPDPLVSRLISQAESINITFNELLLKTLQKGMSTTLELQKLVNSSEADIDGLIAQDAISPIYFVEEETVADVVKRIKARPPNPANIHRATKTVDQLMKDLAENPPEESEFSPAEWDQMWAKFEHDMKMSARQKNITEGLF